MSLSEAFFRAAHVVAHHKRHRALYVGLVIAGEAVASNPERYRNAEVALLGAEPGETIKDVMEYVQEVVRVLGDGPVRWGLRMALRETQP